jgi:hypothetical protein
MKTPIVARDLRKEAPHSPRARFGGFAILGRTIDKCRAVMAGTLGEYHFDCPLDNQLFRFKGVTADQFTLAVTSAKNYEDVATWLESTGTRKTPYEINAWSDRMECTRVLNLSEMSDAQMREGFHESCQKLGLDPELTTWFGWLEADDEASFHPHLQASEK